MKYYCDEYRHLVCIPYSKENLHKMAEDLCIKRCWFHINHYDIPKRRIEEIMSKCEVIGPRQIFQIVNNKIQSISEWVSYRIVTPG
jgi:hypothetical protein